MFAILGIPRMYNESICSFLLTLFSLNLYDGLELRKFWKKMRYYVLNGGNMIRRKRVERERERERMKSGAWIARSTKICWRMLRLSRKTNECLLLALKIGLGISWHSIRNQCEFNNRYYIAFATIIVRFGFAI